MTAPTHRSYSIWLGPACIHTGSVAAPSDAAGVRGILSNPPPGVPLDPLKYYRVRVGSAVASSRGDEFARTAESSSMPADAPAEAARVERERVEGEAKKQMLERVVEQLAGMGPLADHLDADAYGRKLVESIGVPAGVYLPDEDEDEDGDVAPRALDCRVCPRSPDARHKFYPRPTRLASHYDYATARTVVTATVGPCAACGEAIFATVGMDPFYVTRDPRFWADSAAEELTRALGGYAEVDPAAAWSLIAPARAAGAVVSAAGGGNGNGLTATPAGRAMGMGGNGNGNAGGGGPTMVEAWRQLLRSGGGGGAVGTGGSWGSNGPTAPTGPQGP